MSGAPTVAVVDGFSTGSELGKLLSLSGGRCVHVRSASTVSEYFSRSFRPGDYLLDLGYVDSEDQLIQRLAELGVSRVVAGTESGVILADTLSHRLGLPGNRIELVQARRDKSLMTRAVHQAGLSVPLGRAFDSAEAAADWYARHIGGDAVVKPLDSAGSDNVHFCGSAGEVTAACRLVLAGWNLYGRKNRQVLVQRRVTGQEFYVNTVSYRGTHRAAEIWRYTKSVSLAGSPVYDFEEPVWADSADGLRILDFVFGALNALGIRSSAAHTEVMLTDRGPVFIESGARLSGATIPDLVEKLCGISQAALFVRSILNPASFLADAGNFRPEIAAVRNVSLINPVSVRHQAAGWLDRLHDLPTAVGVAARQSPGQPMPATVDLMSAPGFLYLASDNPVEVAEDYNRLREWERRGLYGR